tara:strand:- start:1252 stop:1986 length:735 start_codon:yes stop_codon:yes gene_type:complete
MTRKYYADVKLTNSNTVGGADVYVLNNTWMLDKAVAFARSAYEKAVKEEKKVLGGHLARWHDFRLNLNPSDGNGTVSYTELMPSIINADTGLGTLLTSGDFVASTARDEGTNTGYQFGFWESGGQYNIVKEYEKSGSTEDSPDDIEVSMPYEAIDDDATTTTFIELQQQGNEPPYSKDSMNDQQLWRHAGEIYSNANGTQKLSTGILCIPLGVVMIVPKGSSNPNICIHAKLGDYKGIASEAMS